ncbi:MAG: hypothetical protein HQK64_10940 [Desulfamplus sp.]|nr:hypothetical protein [Desulfamplus sp.]MBF0242973.1 hypothetical protein [Desulfamplus sp.]
MQQLRFLSPTLPKLALATFTMLIFITGCSQIINKSPSAEYIAGQQTAESYAKQDAIESRCIDYPISVNKNILKNIKRHINRFKADKSSEFIKGFSENYGDQYKEYMNLYCDSLDSSEIYIKQ